MDKHTTMLILFLLACFSTTVSSSDLRFSVACHHENSSTAEGCFVHNLRCPVDSSVVVAGAEWRYKNNSANCSSQSFHCDARERCCSVEDWDCSAPLPAARLATEVGSCWDREACSVRLSEDAAAVSCAGDTPSPPHYSHVRFFCVPKTSEMDFATSGTVTGPTASIRYKSAANQTEPGTATQQISFCRVESADCAQHPVEVVLYTGSRRRLCAVPYTHVVVGQAGNCSVRATVTAETRTTPFLAQLTVASGNDVDSAWVAVRATNESNVRVLCATTSNQTLPPCVLPLPSTVPPTLDIQDNDTKDNVTTAMPGSSREASVRIALIVVGCLLFACVVVVIILCYSRRVRNRSQQYETNINDYTGDHPVSMATYGCWMEDSGTREGMVPRGPGNHDQDDAHYASSRCYSQPVDDHLKDPDRITEEPSEPPGVVDTTLQAASS